MPTVSPGWVTEPAKADAVLPKSNNAVVAIFTKFLVMFPSLQMRALGRRDPWQIAPRQLTVLAYRAHQRGASQMVGLHDPFSAGRAPTLGLGEGFRQRVTVG